MNAGSAVRALIACSFTFNLGAAMAGLTATLLALSLGATPLQLGLIGMMWPASYTVACLFSGQLSDMVSRRLLCIAGCIIACIAYLVMVMASSPGEIMLIGIPVGIAMSLFWPPLEAWLAQLSAPSALRRNFGIFNIAWSTGAAPGPLLAGVAVRVSFTLSIITSVSLMGLSGIMLAAQKPDVCRGDSVREAVAGNAGSKRFLYLAWVANFATYFTIGILRSLFPKLGQQLGMSSPSIGCLLSTITFAQVLVFALLARGSGWHYRLAPLLLSQSFLLVASLLVYLVSRFGQILVPMALSGAGAGISYFSSIYYSINAPVRLGTRSAMHEALIGLGVVAGPLSGGIVAQRWGLRGPYLLSCFVSVVGIGITASVGKMLRSKEANSAIQVVP